MKKINLNQLSMSWNEKQMPQKFRRYAGMLIMLLTLGVGQMWAWSGVDFCGDPAGGWSNYISMPETGDNTGIRYLFIYIQKDQYFKFRINSKPVGMGSSYTFDDSNNGVRMYRYNDGDPTAAKYGLKTGIVRVHVDQSTGDNNESPWVWVSRPTIHIRHNWSGSSWSDEDMTDNNDGTYKYYGNYGGNYTYVGVTDMEYNADGSNCYKKFENTATVNGSPSNGDRCIFEYDASGYRSSTNSITNTGSLTITKLCGLTYNGNGRTGGTVVPSALSDQKYGSSVTLSSNAMTKTGYTLTGWNTANDGSGTHYDLGASFTFSDKSNTLYAEWTQTITVDKNTGTTAGSMSICFNAGSLKSFTAATKTDWILDSYWTTEDESGSKVIEYDASTGTASLVSSLSGYITTGKWTRTAATTLYAHWKQTYTVTYNANYPASATSTSGSVPADATEYASGATVTVKSNSGSLAAGGYTFAGWQTEPTGGTSYVAGSGTFSITEPTTLYAKWTENKRNVTISAGTGGTVDKTSASVGVATTTTVTATAQPGYRFTGWTATNCNVASSSSASTTLSGNGTTGDATLVANFARTYAYLEGRMTVYNAARNNETNIGSSKGGWSESSTNISMDYDGTNHRFYRHTYKTPAQLSATQTDGTAQNQWFSITRSTVSGSLTNPTTYHPSSNTDLTTKGIANKKAAQTSTTTANYKFNSAATDGYVILYFDEAGVWFELEHTLNYNGNGSTSGSAPAEAYHENGTNATAAANPFTKTNYTFGGWNTTQYITGTSYAASASVPMNTNTTLYAKWTRSITLNQNGATTNGSSSVTATYNCATLPSFTNPSKLGYTFGGWYTANDGSGLEVINASKALQASKSGWTDGSGRFTNTSSGATLYAKWTQTVTLNANTANHGSGDNTSATIVLNATAKSSITHCTPATGYHLVGYYTAETGGTKVLNEDGSFASSSVTDYITSSKWIKAGATTLYAHYEPNTYQVHFNGNGNTGGSMSNETGFTYDEAKALTACGFTKTGYDFAGWATSASGVVVYDDEEEVTNLTATNDGTAELYAKWTAHTYTITLDDQDATSEYHKTSVTVTYNQDYINDSYPVPESPDLPWKTAYKFQGWYTGEGGTGLQIMDELGALQSSKTNYTDSDGKWIYANNVTLYAKWTQSSAYGFLDITVNNNGGSGGAIVAVYNSSSLESFTASTRTGYNFQGFFTDDEGGDQVIDEEGNIVEGDVTGFVDDGKWINSTSSATIYAQWEPIEYTVTFDNNDDASYVGGEGGTAPDDMEVDYTTVITMPDAESAKVFTRAGYTLNGWALAAHKAKGAASETLLVDYDYRAGNSYSGLTSEDGATVTLYPKWLGNIYAVSFNPRGASVYPTSANVRFGETYGSSADLSGSLPEPYSIPAGKEFIGWYTSPTGGTLVTSETQMTTIGAHTLYARYSDIAMVYFKNTIGWSEVYVTYAAYWDTYNDPSKGTGNTGLTYHKMTNIAGTNVYYDEIPSTILANWTAGDNSKIAFNSQELLTDKDKHAPTTGDYDNYNKGEVVYRLDFDSRATMFVPKNVNTNNTDGNYKLNGDAQYISTGYKDGTSSDPEYTSGYWMKYGDTYSGYLFSYQKNGAGDFSAEYGMNTSVAGDTIFVYSVKMDANTRYDLRIRKDCQTTNTKSRQFRYGTQITSAACTDLKLVCDPNNNSWMQTTAAGEYKFVLTCKSDGHMYLTVEYPLAVNDYRVLYSWNDGSAHEYASEYIKPIAADTIDTISVFVHKSGSPIVSRSMKIQKCTAINGSGVPTWSDVAGGTINLTDVTANGVYDFAFEHHASSTPTGALIEKYEGDYYIRTACSDGGWDQYKDREDNVMTYSAYSMTQTLSDPYSHYYCRYVGSTSTDITFAVATKYSPNISGTETGDETIGVGATTLPANANVRFSWNEETNAMARAYIKDAQGEGNARFMVMHGADDDMIFNPDSSAIGGSGSLAANELQFDDMGNWVYQVMLTAKPGAQVSILANYNSADRYLVGDGDSNWETILGGSGSKKYTIMAIYDFKTNRLMNAWTPEGTITEALSNIDMLWLRYKQNAAQQITFSGSGALTNVKVVGAIELRYNDLVGHVSSWTYETRPLLRYFISFPFDVNVSDIFGLHGAELGRDFVIRKYDGAERAKNGLYLGDGDTYWVDLTMDSVMHANEGYSLVFDNEYLNGDLGTIWTNKGGGSSVYLYFPAAAKIASISDANKTTTLSQHVCQDTVTFTYKTSSISHVNADSHWNLIGSPLFVNSYVNSSTGTNGQAGTAARTTLDSYYAYDAEYNLWIPTLYYNESTSTYYACKAMHAMLVQFAGSITWSKNVPSPIAARDREETTVTNRLITLNLLQNGEEGDHTYIKMAENGNPDFMLCEDLFKIDNKKIPNIFSYASDHSVAYNKVPVESQIIRLGLDIRANGTYTIEMPDNVAGQITLVDTYTQTRTNLNIEDYEIYLNRGGYYDRFYLEINIFNAPTAIDGAGDGQGTLKDGKAHKFIMNDQMYILKDGVIYDARGSRVQ